MRRTRARLLCRRLPENAREAIRYRQSPRSPAATAPRPGIRRGRTIGESQSPFRFLPQRLHFPDVGIFQLLSALCQFAFNETEALPELGVGPAQRLLGVYFHKPRQVYQDEQQVADFVFQITLSGVAAGLIELRQFLMELFDHLFG